LKSVESAKELDTIFQELTSTLVSLNIGENEIGSRPKSVSASVSKFSSEISPI